MARSYIKDVTGEDVSTLRGDKVIELLFGSHYERGEFKIVDTNWSPKERWYHRLNRFWAYPLFFILAPFQYIIHGKTGFSDDNRFGYWILKVTGYR